MLRNKPSEKSGGFYYRKNGMDVVKCVGVGWEIQNGAADLYVVSA